MMKFLFLNEDTRCSMERFCSYEDAFKWLLKKWAHGQAWEYQGVIDENVGYWPHVYPDDPLYLMISAHDSGVLIVGNGHATFTIEDDGAVVEIFDEFNDVVDYLRELGKDNQN